MNTPPKKPSSRSSRKTKPLDKSEKDRKRVKSKRLDSKRRQYKVKTNENSSSTNTHDTKKNKYIPKVRVITCFYCHEEGHKIISCPKRNPEAKTVPPPQSQFEIERSIQSSQSQSGSRDISDSESQSQSGNQQSHDVYDPENDIAQEESTEDSEDKETRVSKIIEKQLEEIKIDKTLDYKEKKINIISDVKVREHSEKVNFDHASPFSIRFASNLHYKTHVIGTLKFVPSVIASAIVCGLAYVSLNALLNIQKRKVKQLIFYSPLTGYNTPSYGNDAQIFRCMKNLCGFLLSKQKYSQIASDLIDSVIDFVDPQVYVGPTIDVSNQYQIALYHTIDALKQQDTQFFLGVDRHLNRLYDVIPDFQQSRKDVAFYASLPTPSLSFSLSSEKINSSTVSHWNIFRRVEEFFSTKPKIPGIGATPNFGKHTLKNVPTTATRVMEKISNDFDTVFQFIDHALVYTADKIKTFFTILTKAPLAIAKLLYANIDMLLKITCFSLFLYTVYRIYKYKLNLPLKVHLKLRNHVVIANPKTNDLRNDNSKRVFLKHTSNDLVSIPIIHRIKFRAFKHKILQKTLRRLTNFLFNITDLKGIRIRKNNQLIIDPEFAAQVSVPMINDLMVDDLKLLEKVDYALKNTHSINYDRNNWSEQLLNNHSLFVYNLFKTSRHRTRKIQLPDLFPVWRE